jgi:hypothetical protein
MFVLMDKEDIEKLEGRFVYFSGEKFGTRGTVLNGACYRFESFEEESRVYIYQIKPEQIKEYHVIERGSAFRKEEYALEVMKNGGMKRIPRTWGEVEVPRGL